MAIEFDNDNDKDDFLIVFNATNILEVQLTKTTVIFLAEDRSSNLHRETLSQINQLKLTNYILLSQISRLKLTKNTT